MIRVSLLAALVLAGCAQPTPVQEVSAPDRATVPDRVVVAEIQNEAILPQLSPPAVFGLAKPYCDASFERTGQRARFEQSWIERGPSPTGFSLQIDGQFPDGNDFLVALQLEEVEQDGKRLLLLAD